MKADKTIDSYYKNKLKVWIIACFLLANFLAPQYLFSEKKTEYVIYIKQIGLGYKKRVVYNLEDMFQLHYACERPTHKIFLFQPGRLIKSSDKGGPIYYIELYSKIPGKNKVLILLIPFNYPDPRRAHHN